MFKKITAFLLAVLMMTALVTTVSANPLGFPESKVHESSEWITAEEMTVLYKLGISPWDGIPAMSDRVDEVASRWIMCYFLGKITDIDATKPQEFETLFNDLTSEHQYYNLIKGAVKAGYMNGYPDGAFRPNNPISTMEAATVCLRVLGYEPYMAVMGREKALQKTELLDGLPVEDQMTLPQLLKMFWNMLNSPAVKVGSISTENGGADGMVDFTVDESYLGFEHLRGVFYKTAVLDGVKGTTLNEGGDNIKDGYITVGGVTYKYGTDVTNLLGYKVNYVYKMNGTDNAEIMYLFKSDDNKELVLTHEDIVDFENGVYTYEDGDKDKEAVLSAQTRIVYNGVANPEYEDSELVPAFGKVTLIDYDGKKGYEVAKIENYEFYYASAVDGEKQKVYDKEGETPRILDVYDSDLLTIRDGEKFITVDRIKIGNLVAVKRSSKNSAFDRVEIETFKVTHKGIQIKKVNEETVSSADTDFAIWEGMAEQIVLGKTYNFYEFDGQIVYAVEGDAEGAEVVYLLSLGDDGTAFSSEIKVALVEMNGNYAEFDCVEKLSIDGVQYTNADSMRTKLMESARLSIGFLEDYPFAQPAKIKFNGNGKVRAIDTVYYNEGAEDKDSLQKFPTDTTKVRYDGHGRGLYAPESESSSSYNKHVVSIGSATKSMAVPDERFEEGLYSTQRYEDYTNYKADIIEWEDNSRLAKTIFVYYSGTGNISDYTNTAIIADLRKELNEEGDTVCSVDSWIQAIKYTYTCDEGIFAQLSVGDVCKFAVNKKDEVISLKKIYNIDEDFPKRGERTTATSLTAAKARARATFFGSLVAIEDGFMRVTEALPTDIEGYDPDYNVDNFYMGTAPVFRYTEVRGVPTVEKVSISSAVPYTTDNNNPSLLILNINQGVKQIYIIEK